MFERIKNSHLSIKQGSSPKPLKFWEITAKEVSESYKVSVCSSSCAHIFCYNLPAGINRNDEVKVEALFYCKEVQTTY